MGSGELIALTKGSMLKPNGDQQPVKKQNSLTGNFRLVENPADSLMIFNEEEPFGEVSGPSLGNDTVLFGGYIFGEGYGGYGNGTGGGGMENPDRFPEFPGGLDGVKKYIETHPIYPEAAIRQKIFGVVIISFDVDPNGDVVNIKVDRSIDPVIDEAAVNAVKSLPKWKPGLWHGRPVTVKFSISVRFMSP